MADVERDLATRRGRQLAERARASTQEALGCLQEVLDEGTSRISGIRSLMSWRLFLIPEASTTNNLTFPRSGSVTRTTWFRLIHFPPRLSSLEY